MRNFDFDRYRRAVEHKDAETWVTFFADDATWTEYRHTAPPRSPHVMQGRDAIEEFVRTLCSTQVTIAIGQEVVGGSRAAYHLTCELADGRRIVENVILELRSGLVTQQLDVEAWD